MSPQISQEALLIVMSLYGGLVLAVCYDMVRVCRRIFKVGIVSMIIQDVIYWTISAMLKKLNTCVFGKVKKIVTKMLKPLQKLYKLDKLKRVKKEKRKRKWQQKTEKYQQED